MRRIPIPILAAAIVAITAVVVIIQLVVMAPPVVVGDNATVTLTPGQYYVWWGAAGSLNFTSDKNVNVYYTTSGDVVVWAPQGLTAKVLYDAGTYTSTGDYAAIVQYNNVYYLLLYISDASSVVVFNLTQISSQYATWDTKPITKASALSSICGTKACLGFVRLRYDAGANTFYMDLVDKTGASSSVVLLTYSSNIGGTAYLLVTPWVRQYDNNMVWVFMKTYAALYPTATGTTTVRIYAKPPT